MPGNVDFRAFIKASISSFVLSQIFQGRMKIYVLLGLVLGYVALPLNNNNKHNNNNNNNKHHHIKHLHNALTESLSTRDPVEVCNACKQTVGVVHLVIKSGQGQVALEKLALMICKHITTQRVCVNGKKIISNLQKYF